MASLTAKLRCRGIALAGFLAALTGCVGSAIPARPDVPAASPAVRGADSGLELRWWVIPDDGDVIARALAGYEKRLTPADSSGRDVWRANGLRLVAIPIADLDTLQARFQTLRSQVLISDLRAAGIPEESLARVASTMAPAGSSSQEQWLGEVPRWTDAVRGPQFGPGTGRGSVVKMDAGPLALGAGRLRLLVRAWTVPTTWAPDHAAAGLRVELAPQFESARPPSGGREIGLLPPLDVEDQGLILSRLVLTMTLDGTEAILIVPDRPEVDWEVIASGEPVLIPPAPGVFGPPAPEGVTLGEAMLSSEPASSASPAGATPLPRRPAKAVIVLVPRVRDRFQPFGP